MNNFFIKIFSNESKLLAIIMGCETYFIKEAKILYEKQSLRSSVKSMPNSVKSSATTQSKMELNFV